MDGLIADTLQKCQISSRYAICAQVLTNFNGQIPQNHQLRMKLRPSSV